MLQKLLNFLLFTTLFIGLTLSAAEKKITLSGQLSEGKVKRLSASQIIEGLEFIQKKVYNPYEKRSNLYGGVLLDAFVKKYAKESTKTVKFKAIDGYEAVIPRELWEKEPILIATDLNGKRTDLKTKGPLQIVFLDFQPDEIEDQATIPLWIWMVTKIEFR